MSNDNIMIPVPVGGRFIARDKGGNIAEFVFVGLHEPDICGNTVRLWAVGTTRDVYAQHLAAAKGNNPFSKLIQETTLDELCVVVVEPEWFNQRVITLKEGTENG